MTTPPVFLIATFLFALAVLHTFMTGYFRKKGENYPPGSIKENLFHFLGEVEVVFGLWAGVFVVIYALMLGGQEAVAYTNSLNFTEPLFVFAVMAVSATAPILAFAQKAIVGISRLIPGPAEMSLYIACLIVGPLLGSLITEPAAMTVTALLVKEYFFTQERSPKFLYLTLAVLFVNISIGGVLTNFAAPPVLMVASTWQWTSGFMFSTFGCRAIVAVVINAIGVAMILRKDLRRREDRLPNTKVTVPWGLSVLHLIFLAAIVLTNHHPVIFLGIFLFFLGMVAITSEYQTEIKLKESLLVAFFLAGLVVLGGPQKWWLAPLMSNLTELPLYLGTIGLTAVTDNAALTYLGSQLDNLTDSFKYFLVAGAVVGGGLTVIANAPNPAGNAILQGSFGKDGIQPLKLLLAAIGPTIVALIIFLIGK